MTSRTFGERPKLSEAQASLYLERLGVSVSDVRARPKDHALLSELILAQLFTIPFESNRIHISDDAFARGDDAEPIKFLSGPGLPDELDDIFDLVMKGRRGAVCFPLQQLFSALLRFLGFTVSNIHARSNIAVHHRLEGCLWGPATHIILLVQVDDGRLYFCDVGYGGGASTAPVPLEHGARVGALSPSETYELRREVIPNADVDAYHHAVEGWTLYRHLGLDPSSAVTLPVLHFKVADILAPVDAAMLNFYVAKSPDSPQARRCLTFRLLPHSAGGRQALVYYEGESKARYYVREGNDGRISEEEVFEPTVGNMARVLRDKFAMSFSQLR